jgi:hypothetical protein
MISQELGPRDPVDISNYYDRSTGSLRGSLFSRYTNPLLPEHTPEAPQYFDPDVLKRITHEPRDLDCYISQRSGKLFRMIVQAAPNTHLAGAWRSVKVKGNAATLLKVASWAVGYREGRIHIEDTPLIIGKSILILPAILFLVAHPVSAMFRFRILYFSHLYVASFMVQHYSEIGSLAPFNLDLRFCWQMLTQRTSRWGMPPTQHQLIPPAPIDATNTLSMPLVA